jgi:hypothetical protein
LPIAFSVTASFGAGLYWRASRLIDGMAMPTRISTGTSVQITSMKVLCVVLDGTGFALAR